MTIKKAFSSDGFLIFPIVVLFTYGALMYVQVMGVEIPVPAMTTFAILAVVILLELAFPYAKSVSQKPVVIRDLTSTLVILLFTGTVMGIVFSPFLVFFFETVFGRRLFFGSSGQIGPFWLQLILAGLFLSLMQYCIHRLQHRVSFLWKLHSYHHGITDLKASNTFVSHPVDWSLRNVLPPLILSLVGFNPMAILFGVGLLNVIGVFSHCGAGLHAGWLNYIFITPEIHRWHHSAEVPNGRKFSVNYGLGIILWDRIFGTYYLPIEDGKPLQPEEIAHPDGIPDEGNYFKLFFLTRYLPKFLKGSINE
jgi:sterol desaturase/sphingolipid hydroxylase (fatty acid hydroxylase superfamily)